MRKFIVFLFCISTFTGFSQTNRILRPAGLYVQFALAEFNAEIIEMNGFNPPDNTSISPEVTIGYLFNEAIGIELGYGNINYVLDNYDSPMSIELDRFIGDKIHILNTSQIPLRLLGKVYLNDVLSISATSGVKFCINHTEDVVNLSVLEDYNYPGNIDYNYTLQSNKRFFSLLESQVSLDFNIASRVGISTFLAYTLRSSFNSNLKIYYKNNLFQELSISGQSYSLGFKLRYHLDIGNNVKA